MLSSNTAQQVLLGKSIDALAQQVQSGGFVGGTGGVTSGITGGLGPTKLSPGEIANVLRQAKAPVSLIPT
jgi:hypothetical protein